MNKQNEKAEKESEEFKNFRDLAKNLIAVPKAEIDRKKAIYERKKNKREKPTK